MKKIISFVYEAKEELQKVNWPNKQQVINYTIVVMIISLLVAFFLGGLDYVFGGILKRFIG